MHEKESTGHISLTCLRKYAIPNLEREKYKDMLLGESLLRATGVVVDGLSGSRCPPPMSRPLDILKFSTMRKTGNKEELRLAISKQPAQHVRERTGSKATGSATVRPRSAPSGIIPFLGGRGGKLRKF